MAGRFLPAPRAQSASGRGAATGASLVGEAGQAVFEISVLAGLTVEDLGRRGGAGGVEYVQDSIVVALDEPPASAAARPAGQGFSGSLKPKRPTTNAPLGALIPLRLPSRSPMARTPSCPFWPVFWTKVMIPW